MSHAAAELKTSELHTQRERRSPDLTRPAILSSLASALVSVVNAGKPVIKALHALLQLRLTPFLLLLAPRQLLLRDLDLLRNAGGHRHGSQPHVVLHGSNFQSPDPLLKLVQPLLQLVQSC